MPLSGTLDVGEALTGAPTMASLAPEPWSLPGAELLQVSYEVDEQAALAATPPSLHPSIPPYATFTVARFPVSPAGPFTLAMIRLIVRAGVRPRGLLLGAFTGNPVAADGLTTGWGYRLQPADVELQSRHDIVRGTVAVGGRIALDVSMQAPEPIAAGDLELFDNLHLTNVAGQEPVIVQVDPTYEYASAHRGAAELAAFDAGALHVDGIDALYKIVAVSCRADVVLHPPRFIMDPVLPATKGTRRLP
jgi:hypothetical protein